MPLHTPSKDNIPKIEERSASFTRRVFHRALAGLGLLTLADGITGGKLRDSLAQGDPDLMEHSHEDSERIAAAAERIIQQHGADLEGLSPTEKAHKLVNYLGSALFVWGIKDLMPDVFESGHGHIHRAHYGCLMALTHLKHLLSDEEQRHHLKEEWVSSLKALGIISATIVMAEGLNMDIKLAYEELNGRSPAREDKVALMTMLASTISPLATTVGSAGIIRNISNDVANGNEAVMAVCTSHISNLSGYLLFGDPPFIAMCEKYGFEEAIGWQLKNMWPLALYSLFSSTVKINCILNKEAGIKNPLKKAREQSKQGLMKNIPVLTQMIAKSLANTACYFVGGEQALQGIQVTIGEVLTERLSNLCKLPFSDAFDEHGHEIHEGLMTDPPEVRIGNDLIVKILWESKTESCHESVYGELEESIKDNDWKELERVGGNMGISNIQFFIQVLKDLHDDARINDSHLESDAKKGVLDYLNPLNIYDRATDVKRMQTALGHNVADVIDVFPFQAGCVPFLTPVFQDLVKGLDSMGFSAPMKEAIIFFMIMIFSMFADNYVGCKIGLELLPEKPQIALIASIQGGSHSAIGNMANIAQFNLNTFSLKSSLKQLGWHLDNAAIGFAHSTALSLLQNAGICTVPEALNNKPVNDGPEVVAQGQHSRRSFLGVFGTKKP